MANESDNIQLITQAIDSIIQQQRDIVACLDLTQRALYALDKKVDKLAAAIDQIDLRKKPG